MPTFSELFAYNAFKSKFKRTWMLCMTPADTAAFSSALRAAYPSIRFVSEEYWRHFVDWDRFKRERAVWERQWAARIERTPVRFHYVKNLDGESLHYWDSLTDPAEKNYWAWIEPPGWRPQWKPPDAHGVRELENIPACEFIYRHSSFQSRRSSFQIDGVASSDDELVARHSRQTVTLYGDTFEVRWNRDDETAAAFGKNVFKILRKLTVDRYIAVQHESRRAFTGQPYRHPAWCLVGHGADAWTLKRRHNYLTGSSGGPLLKSAAYRFRPEDVFTARERTALDAQEKANFEARVRQLLEESKQRSIEWRKAHPKSHGVKRSRRRPPTA